MRAAIRAQAEVAMELLFIYVVVFVVVVRPDFLTLFSNRSFVPMLHLHGTGAALGVLISFLRALYLFRDQSPRRPEVVINAISGVVVGGLLYVAHPGYKVFAIVVMVLAGIFVTKSVTYYLHRLADPHGISSVYYAFVIQYLCVVLSAFFLPFFIRSFLLP